MTDDCDFTITDCDICFRTFRCYGLMGGSAVCSMCYPAFQFGYEQERENWEKWTGKCFSDMYKKHENKNN